MNRDEIITIKELYNDLIDIDVLEYDDYLQVIIDTRGNLTSYAVEDGMLYVQASNDDYEDKRELFLDLNLDDDHIDARKEDTIITLTIHYLKDNDDE